ncbi:hypothetical protein LguiB_020654 [Lonicera macranthoides]
MVMDSIVDALSTCGRSKYLIHGRIVHGMVLRFKLGNETIIVCLMGLSSSARKVFDEMPQRNVVSWTGMTPGDVGGKTSVQGLELFRRIRAESEDSPMAIMIVAVLSGCADIGALDFGRFINGSNMLASEQTPNEITFVSMISACTHAGRLEEAIELIEQMPIDPDAMEWEIEIGRNGGKEGVDVGYYALIDPTEKIRHPKLQDRSCPSQDRSWELSAKDHDTQGSEIDLVPPKIDLRSSRPKLISQH